MEPTDDELRAGIDAGRPDWDGIYRTYRGVMWRAARRALGSDDYAALAVSVPDVVQEVMTKLMEKPAGQGIPPGTENIAGFLWIAVDRAARQAKAKELRSRQEPLDEGARRQKMGALEDFEDAVDDALICEQLDACLDVLDQDERYAYVARFKHGCSLADIGAGLGGKSDSWAARLCARAVRKLTAAAGIEAASGRSARRRGQQGGDHD